MYNQTIYGKAPVELCDVVEEGIRRIAKYYGIKEVQVCNYACDQLKIKLSDFMRYLYQNKINLIYEGHPPYKEYHFELLPDKSYPDFMEC